MKIDKEWVEAYFDYGIDVANRRIFIGDIDHQSVDAAIKGMYLMDAEDHETPCELFISSYGGEVYDALALHDIINTIQCPVHTFAYGKCMSAAPLLLAAGEPGHRWVAPNVFLMTHDSSEAMEGKMSDLENSIKHTRELDDCWITAMCSVSNKDAEFWKEKSKGADFYFGAHDAIEWGLADQVWVEKS